MPELGSGLNEDQCRREGTVWKEEMVDLVKNFILPYFNTWFLLGANFMHKEKAYTKFLLLDFTDSVEQFNYSIDSH